MSTTALLPTLVAALALQAPDELRPLEGEKLRAARALIADIAKRLEDVRLVHARYVQRQESILLAKPLVTEGRLHLRSDPPCLVLEVREPRHAIVRSDAVSHQVYDPERKRAERYLFESNELARALIGCFTARLSEVEESFVLVAFERDEECAELGLAPRKARLRAVLRSLHLVIRLEDAALVGFTHSNAEGEKVACTFTEIEHDPEEDRETEVFDRPLPPDVELVIRRIGLDEERN